MANSLLESSHEKVKFFGALTYTVKLNSDSSVDFALVVLVFTETLIRESLGLLDAKTLLNQLINWLIRLVDPMAGPLVVRKLCSTLVVFFLHFSSLWPNCEKHLIHSLCTGEAAPLEILNSTLDIAILVEKLTLQKASAALWFSSALAEEVGKTDANHIKT